MGGGWGCKPFVWDDGYLLGPSDTVFRSLETFSTEVEYHLGHQLQRSKTEVFFNDGSLHENTPAGLIKAGANIEGRWEPGMLCYGVPVGSDKYILYMLNTKVTEVEEHVA